MNDDTEKLKENGLNEAQEKIANLLEGMIVVDAGPGTGKTHTVVQRCINMLRQENFDPKDLVMLTFTKNAAAEMKDRVQKKLTEMLTRGEVDDREYKKLSTYAKQVYIGTFDSFCLSIVKQSPNSITRFFGFDEGLTRSAGITENESINLRYFSRFLDRFLSERGSEFGDLAAIAAEAPEQVYRLINRLMSRGILPMKGGDGRFPWFGGNDGRDLVGDVKALREEMDRNFEGLDKANADKYRDIPDAEGFDLFAKTPDPKMLDMAAEDDRTELLDMVHEIFYEYIRRSVADDHLTFGLVASFAFIVLYDDDDAKERVSTRYLIVDEFQDTNSNQLMIALMVLKEPNLCVVGDWKQGIYGFRFVSIENITMFERKVVELRRFLNDDRTRIRFSIPETVQLALVNNYRSSQLVIDKAYASLKIPGSQKEELDIPFLDSKITMIGSQRTEIGTNTAFECVKCESRDDEIDETLRRILNYVQSGKYHICRKDGTVDGPRFSDIAVLCRNTDSCRRIYEACIAHGIPAFLQGEVSIMTSREGKLLLAWLRYISNDKDDWGLVPILADMNYPFDEIQYMKKYDPEEGKDHVQDEIKDFRRHLRSKRRRVTELISDIFSYYGLDNDVTQAITAVLSSTHRNSLMTIPDLIGTIENDIANDTKYDVDGLPESDAVTIQTMHKSKGLEYPIVILPRIDTRNFPAPLSDKDMFTFSDVAGVRCRKEVIRFGKDERKIGESWKSAVVRKSLRSDYSEERRLLFVAISRAKQYVTMIAGPKASQFFSYYATDAQDGSHVPVPVISREEDTLIPKPEVKPFASRRKNLAVHDLMRFDLHDHRPDGDSDEVCGKGMQYGTEVHKLAELLVKGYPVDERKFSEFPQLVKAREIIERLRSEGAELRAEVECSLPLNDLNATVRGVIDLIAEFPDRVEVHDWKTDVESDNRDEYKIQLSVYAHVLEHFHPDKPVTCHIDWVSQDGNTDFDPLDMDVIRQRAREFLTIR